MVYISLGVLLCCNMWMTCFMLSSQEDSIHLLKVLAFKEHTVCKENLQFAQTQDWHLGHLFSDAGPHQNPEILMMSKVSQNPKLSFNWAVISVDYCQNWKQFSLLWQKWCVSLKHNNPDPVVWEEQGSIAFKNLEDSSINPPVWGIWKGKHTLSVLSQKHVKN